MAFTLPALPYAEDALEPSIDARTMNIHHTKHHQAYIDKLNAALDGQAELQDKSIDELCRMAKDLSGAIRNNGGGHFNHSLFWQIMAPAGQGGEPSAALAAAIDSAFGSMDAFKEQFQNAGATRFGSGWAWLCVKDGGLEVCSTANQDNPLMPEAGCGGTPILGLDVWEHAYYLNYQNRRGDYVNAVLDRINWSAVAGVVA